MKRVRYIKFSIDINPSIGGSDPKLLPESELDIDRIAICPHGLTVSIKVKTDMHLFMKEMEKELEGIAKFKKGLYDHLVDIEIDFDNTLVTIYNI